MSKSGKVSYKANPDALKSVVEKKTSRISRNFRHFSYFPEGNHGDLFDRFIMFEIIHFMDLFIVLDEFLDLANNSLFTL